jgi:hypothetical protein
VTFVAEVQQWSLKCHNAEINHEPLQTPRSGAFAILDVGFAALTSRHNYVRLGFYMNETVQVA